MRDEKYYQAFLRNNLYPRELKKFSPGSGENINFSSSDYLGLAQHPFLIARSQEYAAQYGVGASASRLVTGNLAVYEDLEKKLAHAMGKPAALILGTGYQTNLSVLEALLDPKIIGEEPVVFCDRLCHVSLLTTPRRFSKLQRFQHNDLDHLQILLEKYVNHYPQKPRFILVESVYSMDGDHTDFPALIALAKKYDAFLYVDDAHAVGVYGQSGWGMAAEYASDISLIMGTFSKALGSFGGYVACSDVMRDYLINRCKGLIYSTGLPPTVLGAISAVIELLPTLNQERKKLLDNSLRVRKFFQENNLNCGRASTHIIPWIVGDAARALHLSESLEKQGILGVTIRPPSVPVDQCRIRFCLSALHSDADVDYLMHAILQSYGS